MKVKFTLIDRILIKYELPCKIYCERLKKEIANSNTYTIGDGIWKKVFPNKTLLDDIFKKKKVIYKNVLLSHLGYDYCDSVINNK